jgi:bacterioferritin
MSGPGEFLADIKGIRQRARQHLGQGAVTKNYGGKVEDAIALLNHAVATEIVCFPAPPRSTSKAGTWST